MSKNVAIKLLILLVVTALVYSIFWFFKVGQLEKQVRNFINDNNALVSSGQVSVSGFPFSQKVVINDVKFALPISHFGDKQVTIKNLVATSGVFASEFVIESLEEVAVQDSKGSIFSVEFASLPEIKFSVVDSKIIDFSYSDKGYRILNAEKALVYAAASSNISLQSSTDAEDKIVNKIRLELREVEGFDLSDVYRNSFEAKVVDGIKTGEIILGNNVVLTEQPTIDPVTGLPLATVAPVAAAIQPVPAVVVPQPEVVPAPAAAVPGQELAQAPVVADPNAAIQPNAGEIAAAQEVIKNNVLVELEYVLTPNKTEQNAQIPVDPTQVQELPVQYTKTVKFTNFEISNPLFKININGELTFTNDDNHPFGSLAFKVEKIDNLLSFISSSISKIIAEKRVDIAAVAPVDGIVNSPDNSYPDFLAKISVNLVPVLKEIAAKNAVSKDDIAEFDLRREKNLDFLVNETPTREILGKF